MIQCFSKTTQATTGSGTRFFSLLGGQRAWSTAQDQHRTPIPAAGTFRNLRVRCRTGLAASSSRTFDVYHNGTVTALSVTIGASDTTIHTNSSDEVSIAAGDTVTLGSTLTGTDANIQIDLAIEFEGATGVSVYGGPHDALSTGTAFHNIQAMDSTSGGALAIDDTQSLWPLAGTMTRWDMRLLTAPGGVTARHFVIFKNGTIQDGTGGTPDTTINISGTSTTGTASFSLTVAAGDLLSWRATVTGVPAGSTPLPGFTFTADVDGQWAICASDDDSFSGTIPTYIGQNPLNWDTTEANVAMIGNVTSFDVTGWRIQTNLADNGRTFTPRVSGVDVGPTGTMAGGLTTLTGGGSPATITSADTWTFKTTPGANGRNCIVGLIGEAESQLRPGPLVNGVLLRFSRVNGGMLG